MRDQWTDELRSRMEGHQEAPPEGLWDAVQAGVSRPKVLWWPWAAGVVAAAAAVVLAVFLWKPADAPVLSAVPGERVAEAIPAPAEPILEPGEPMPAEPVPAPSAPQVHPRHVVHPEPEVLPEPVPEPTQVATQEPASVPTPEPAPEPVWSEPPVPTTPVPTAPRRQKTGRFQISVTSGGMLLAQGPANVTKGYGVPYNPGMDTPTPMVKSPITTQMLSRNRASTTEAQHRRLPRVSLGISYEFAPHWSIGTGLTYSPLRSDYTTVSGTTETQTTRYMHYLGIPVNLQYRLWEWKRLSFFLSAGPMVETAVGARVDTHGYVSGKLASEQQENIQCKDWRWSLNAGAGIQWLLGPVGLFAQPGLSWHIPRDGGMESSYTARPLAFELDFGARWNF